MRSYVLLIFFACSVATFRRLCALDLTPYAKADAPLLHELKERRLQQWLELTVASYKANGVRDEAYDEKVIAVLTHVARHKAGLNNERSHQDTLSEAKILWKGEKGKNKIPKCRDSLLAWAIWSFRNAPPVANGARLIKPVIRPINSYDEREELGKDRHSYVIALELSNYMMSTWGRPKPESNGLRVIKKAPFFGELFRQSILNDAWNIAPEVFVSLVYDMDWDHDVVGEAAMTAIIKACAESPLPQWAQLSLQAAGHVNAAWSWRGSGWASTVERDHWQEFHRHLAEADQKLEASWASDPSHSITAVIACTVAGASSTTSNAEVWLQRSMSACFDDLRAYGNVSHFTRPRWGGSYQAMFELGQAMANTNRYDTEVPWQFTLALRSIIRDHKTYEAISTQAKAVLGAPATLAQRKRCWMDI